MPDRLLVTAVEAAQMLSVGERTFHEMRRADGFPQPVLLGARCTRWKVADIETYVASLAPTGARPEPAHLRTHREGGQR